MTGTLRPYVHWSKTMNKLEEELRAVQTSIAEIKRTIANCDNEETISTLKIGLEMYYEEEERILKELER